MKNIVLCFDRARDHPGPRDATNAESLLRLLDESDEQITWYHPGTRVAPSDGHKLARLRWREAAAEDARATIAEAYEFLVDWWKPGDRIYMFGVGRGAYCAHALTRLLGTVGVLPDLMDYVLAAYAVPRTRRSPQDWRRLELLAARLAGHREIGVPVQFLGLWDMVNVPGRQAAREPVTNVVAGRHAVAVDGRLGPLRSSCGSAGLRRRSLVPRGALRRSGRARGVLGTGGHRAGLDARRRCAGRRHGAGRLPAAKRRHRANTTPSPGAHARFRCEGCLPARWCTPASTSTCGRIRSTGAGCPPTWCGPTRTGSLAANGWCKPSPRRRRSNPQCSQPPRPSANGLDLKGD